MLEIRDLYTRFHTPRGTLTAVDGVNLELAQGEVLGLVGESGCGKSVTSYAMLGLLAPGLSVRSGRIRWNGADLVRADEKALQRVRGHEIAFISQEPTRALDPMFTVGWQLSASVKRLRGVGGGEALGLVHRRDVTHGLGSFRSSARLDDGHSALPLESPESLR